MNDEEKDDRLNMPEAIAGDCAAQTGDAPFSVIETETDEREELSRQIEEEPDASPAIRKSTRLTLVINIDDDPPNWPDF